MKKLTLLLSFLLVFALQNKIEAQSTIAKAEITFEFVSKGVKGTIGGFESTSSIDFDNPENSVFKGAVAVENENDYTVKGTLTLKGVSKPVSIAFAKKGIQLKGQLEIYSFDYGVKVKKKREDNLVKVTLLFDLK